MVEGRDFYGNLLGFRPSDVLDFGKMPWAPKGPEVDDTPGYFMCYGTWRLGKRTGRAGFCILTRTRSPPRSKSPTRPAIECPNFMHARLG
jgi:hypothetical protein